MNALGRKHSLLPPAFREKVKAEVTEAKLHALCAAYANHGGARLSPEAERRLDEAALDALQALTLEHGVRITQIQKLLSRTLREVVAVRRRCFSEMVRFNLAEKDAALEVQTLASKMVRPAVCWREKT